MRLIALLTCLIVFIFSGCSSEDELLLSPEVAKYLRLKAKLTNPVQHAQSDSRIDSYTPDVIEQFGLIPSAIYKNHLHSILRSNNTTWGSETLTCDSNYEESENGERSEMLCTVQYENYGGTYTIGDEVITWGIHGQYQIHDIEEVNWIHQGYYRTTNRKYDVELLKEGSLIDFDLEQEYQIDQDFFITPVQIWGYGDGENYFLSEVTEPLVCRFACSDAPGMFSDYHSGIEHVIWQQDGKSGEFLIDFGAGKCDKIAYVIENGIKTEISMAEYYAE